MALIIFYVEFHNLQTYEKSQKLMYDRILNVSIRNMTAASFSTTFGLPSNTKNTIGLCV